MLSVPQTAEKVLKELRIQLRDHKNGIFQTSEENICLTCVAMLASEDIQEEEFALLYNTSRFLVYSDNNTDAQMLSLVLRALITLSERGDRARKMKVLLQDLVNLLWHNYVSLAMKALTVLQNVMRHLRKTEASSIAVGLAKALWPYFDEEESWVRERSICSFRDLVRMVLGKEKRWMKNYVHSVLAPLILRMNDKAPKVSQASRSALLAIAELLKWKELKHVVKTQQTWRMADCLMEKNSSRAEQYLHQSLQYLRDPQECVQDWSIRFIGTITRHLKDQSKELTALVFSELQSLQEDGCEFIRCLAAQTSLILESPSEQRTSGGSRGILWCWCR
ncbi:maestro heat-like repeat-containing protein family member 7 [Prinia subflava]|uniref:maestro heat-like repeat-containing protein family member 7 n=1 Tax=Prinia subflava TaxID=208062 RepID=UPI002FE0D2F0